MSYIHVQQLSKRFQVRKKGGPGSFLREKQMLQALEGVSFDIEQGDLIGYIGPNGAGKSTTVKILSGILTPDEGEVLVGERIPWKNRKEHVKHIGVVFGQRMQLWWDVPIADSYSLLKDIYRVPEGDFRNHRDQSRQSCWSCWNCWNFRSRSCRTGLHSCPMRFRRLRYT